MAARNPTSYTEWINEDGLRSREPILAATPDEVMADQVMIMDQRAITLSVCCPPGLFTNSVVAAPGPEVARYEVLGKDVCGSVSLATANELPHDVYARCYMGAAGEAGEINIISSCTVNNTVTATVAAGTLTPTWFNLQTGGANPLNVFTNALSTTIYVHLRMTTAAPVSAIFCDAIAIFATAT